MGVGSRRFDPALFVALGLIWGSTYLAVEIIGAVVAPLTLVALRLGIGAAILTILPRVRGLGRPSRPVWPHLAVVAITGLVVPFSLIAWSQRDIDAGLASIFNAATPLFTLVLASILVADEPLSAHRLGGVVIGFGGVLVVVGGGIHGGGEPAALLAMLGATLSYAITAVWTRRFLRSVSPVRVAVSQVQVGFLLTAGLALAVDRPTLAGVGPDAWAAIAWLGIAASAAAPLAYFRLIARYGAARTAVVNYLIPVVGVGLGTILLGESLQASAILGGLIVAAGVGLASVTPSIAPIAAWSVRLRPLPIG